MILKVDLRWITPKADEEVGYIARVSNPSAKPGDPTAKLIQYLIDHKELSPFEMACMCVEINTTRDISRQILRHRSFHFQEFSQRYSVVPEELEYSFARIQDTKNRQSSLFPKHGDPITKEWADIQNRVWAICWFWYQTALKLGIAKELARKILPEGLTRTRMYMQGTLRDWLFYVGLRQGHGTQLEHQQIAYAIGLLLEQNCPNIAEAAIKAGLFVPFAFND